MENRLYTKDHEWIQHNNDNTYSIGITQHASSELGDIVFIELPDVDDTFDKEDSIGTIEAVKTVAELYTPVNCTIVDVNTELEDDASIINNDPYDAWIIKITSDDDLNDCMTFEEYEKFIGQ